MRRPPAGRRRQPAVVRCIGKAPLSSLPSIMVEADLKLEAIVIPVSDVDRAKAFYADLGWRLDADQRGVPSPGAGGSIRTGHEEEQTCP